MRACKKGEKSLDRRLEFSEHTATTTDCYSEAGIFGRLFSVLFSCFDCNFDSASASPKGGLLFLLLSATGLFQSRPRAMRSCCY